MESTHTEQQGRQVAGLLIESDADRTSYLCEEQYGSISIRRMLDRESSYATEFGVIVFNTVPDQVTLCLTKGPFSYQNGIPAADARTLALALNAAADHAESLAAAEKVAA